MENVAWVVFFLVLIALFAGEPDLHDVLLEQYAGSCTQPTPGDD